MREPFYWKARGAWYVWIDGKQVKLATEKRAAFDRWHELSGAAKRYPPNVTVRQIVDEFLQHVEKRNKPRTLDWYLYFLKPFIKHIGKREKVADLQAHHVTDWVNRQAGWNDTTRHSAITAIKRAFSWAVKDGRLAQSPIRSIEKPRPQKRELVVSEELYKQLIDELPTDQGKDLITFLWETGARVQEVRIIETSHLQGNRVVLPASSGKMGRPRVIYLNDTAAEIVQRLAAEHKEGPIFRNSRGRPWTPDAIKCMLSKFDVPGLCGTAFRHTWCTRALESGIDPITCSILMGHAKLNMVANNYSHLAQNSPFLQQQLHKLG